MPKTKQKKNGKRWKLERASFSKRKKSNYRSNKYRKNSDKTKRPKPKTRGKVWIGGHVRKGKKVKGHYRRIK